MVVSCVCDEAVASDFDLQEPPPLVQRARLRRFVPVARDALASPLTGRGSIPKTSLSCPFTGSDFILQKEIACLSSNS